jgi:GH35 family endo-1,4-beta-xylanase
MNPEHRRESLRITIKNRDGQLLDNKKISVAQTRHDFLFGCNIFALDVTDTSEKQRAYQEHFAALFNQATLPFYWGRYESEQGILHQNKNLSTALWCRDHNIVAKGHPLCWHEIWPAWLNGTSNDDVYRLQLQRIDREVSAFRETISVWDVINETIVMPKFAREGTFTQMPAIIQERGVVSVIKELFYRAHAANPDAILLLNDFNNTIEFEKRIEQCLDAGVGIDAIGIQSHMHTGYWGRDKIIDICERFSRFGIPLHWTEASLISGDIRKGIDFHSKHEKWHSTPEGEARQTEEVEHFYRTLWEQPAVEALTWWDFPDGIWLGAPSGLIREDRTPKPAYKKLHDLVKREWWYKTQELITDKDGSVTFTGQRGQ